MTEDLSFPYSADCPETIGRLAAAPAMQRLRQVGMNCGCEYTAFPIFQRPGRYSRYRHSLGVALIVWRMTGDLRQAAAGLLHDIATPVFAHVIDFVKGDYLTQEATEAGTAARIAADGALMAALDAARLTLDDVADYHRYPVADNDSPRLSADRLEYTLGNILYYGFADESAVASVYDDLCVSEAEDGQPEICFTHPEPARLFADLALRCARLYVSPEDRYAMQRLAELVRKALAGGTLTEEALYRTEPEVIRLLSSSPLTAEDWRAFMALRAVRLTDTPEGCRMPRRIPAKKRCIDPLVRGLGRASRVFPDFGADLAAFRAESQQTWISEGAYDQ